MKKPRLDKVGNPDALDSTHTRVKQGQAYPGYRRVEKASLKIISHLMSLEATRIFLRYYPTVEINAYWFSGFSAASMQAHQRDWHSQVGALMDSIDELHLVLDEAIQSAHALNTQNGVIGMLGDGGPPLQVEVKISSPIARRYFEAINKLDSYLPMLLALEAFNAISTRRADIRRAKLKRHFRSIASTARNIALGLRGLKPEPQCVGGTPDRSPISHPKVDRQISSR